MTTTAALLLAASLWGNAIGAAGGVLLLRRDRPANVVCFGLAVLAAGCGLLAALL